MIALDGEKEFRKSITDINSELRSLKSESKLLEEEYRGQANTVRALSAKQETLTKTLDAQRKKEEETRKGLEHAKASYAKVGAGLEELKTEYEAAVKKMDEMGEASSSGGKEMEKQRKHIKELAEAVKKGEKNYETAAGRIKNWETKLNDARVQTIKANNALEQNEQYLGEAEKAADKCAHSIDGFGKAVKTQINVMYSWKEAVQEAGAEKAFDGVAAAAQALGEMQGELRQVQAATGAAFSEMKAYKNVMEELYQNNYGENLEDVGEAVSVISQNFKKLDSGTLKEASKNAIALRDVFGFGYQEQIRAVKMLMDTFGISSKNAYNLIAQGAQNGLDKNGDLLDVINEYAVHYKQLGADAEGFFNSLSNGAAAGTFSIDKLGDAYKEFGIRVKDTANTTTEAYQILGFNADEIRKKFAQGGESAAEAAQLVLEKLFAMEDKVKQNQAGVDLFGTMWEDLGIEGVKALSNLNGSIRETKDAMVSIQDIKYDNAVNQITKLSRTIQMKIASPLAEKILPGINKGLEEVGDHLEAASAAAVGFGTALLIYKASKSDIFIGIVSGIKKVTAALSVATAAAAANTGAAKGAAAAQALLNAAQSMSPAGLIVTGFAALTAAMAAYRMMTKDTADDVEDLAESLKEKREAVEDSLKTSTESIENAQAEWMANDMLLKKLLELNAVQEKTTGNKAVMRGIVQELSEEIPELAAAFDEETCSINLTDQELQNLIETNKQLAMTTAAQEAMKDIAKGAAEAQIALETADEKIRELKEELESYGNKTALIEFDRADEESQKILELLDNVKKLEGEKEKYQEILEASNEKMETAQNIINENAAALEEYSSAEKEAAEVTAEAAAQQTEAYLNLRNAIEESVSSSISLLQEFSGGTKLTAEEILNNLNSQIDGLSAWADNMEILAGAAGQGMTEEFYRYLAELGPQSANLVQELVNSLNGNSSQFADICKAWTEAMDLNTPLAEKVSSAFEGAGKAADNGIKQQKEHLEMGMKTAYSSGMKTGRDAMLEAEAENMEIAKSIGTKTGKAGAEGFESAKEDAELAVNTVVDTALSKTDALPETFYDIGKNTVLGLADGITENGNAAVDAMESVVSRIDAKAAGKLQIASPSKLFKKYGGFVTQGLAIGIKSAKGEAEASISDVCSGLLHTAEKDLDIHSPSKKFKEKIGEQISKGVAFGIAAKKGQAVKNSKKLAQDVYNSANAWLKDYKKTHMVSLEEETYFWKQVKETVKKGTKAYEEAVKKADKNVRFENNVEEQLKKMETAAKDSEDCYGELYRSAGKYFDNYSVLHNVSLQQEEYYWQQVLKKMKKGTQGYIDALRQLKTVQNEMKAKVKEEQQAQKEAQKQEKLAQKEEKLAQKEKKKQEKEEKREYALTGNALAAYKTYYQVSERAEVQYWDRVRKKFKKGTAERIEADQKYYEAKERYNERLEELNNDYYENCKEINERLEEEIEELTSAYKDAVRERKSEIYSSFRLFDEFTSVSESGRTLLYNLKTQVAGIADWEQQLEKLGGRGILSKGLLQELQELGPEASASIHALNQLSESELREYEKLWEQKNELAEAQAVKENERLREETQSKIDSVKESARAELAACKETYKKEIGEVKKAIEEPLRELANQAGKIGEDAAARMIASIQGNASSKETKAVLKSVNTKISKELGKLEKEGKEIGKNALQGILDGLVNKKKINSSAKSLVNALKSAIQKEADIHSPSRLFKKEIGAQLSAGIAEGMLDSSGRVNECGTNMIKELLKKQQSEIVKQQEKLKSYTTALNGGERVHELNGRLASVPVQQSYAGAVQDGVMEKLEEMIQVLQQGFDGMGNMQMVTDTGVLVGETSAAMSAEFAAMLRRRR